MKTKSPLIHITVMLAVPNTRKAVTWYKKAFGAKLLWTLGSVAGLEIQGAPFFLHEPVQNTFTDPKKIQTTTARIELFADNPDAIFNSAKRAGAKGNKLTNYEAAWGLHRQGDLIDPFGHVWLIGDKTPLQKFHK